MSEKMGLVVELVRCLPLPLRYFLSLVVFIPSILITRIKCWLCPLRWRPWDRVSPSGVWLGSAPVLASDVRRLQDAGITHIVNACWEWGGNPALYDKLGLRFLHVPTLDFEAPSWKDTLRAAEFTRDAIKSGGKVLIHCKAGRGRSVCLALAYFVLYEGQKPRLADAMMRSARPHISRKWSIPLLQAVESLSLANGPPPAAGGRGGAEGEAFLVPQEGERERLALRSVGEGGVDAV